MAKITITIEDLDNGNLQVKCSPTASEVAKAAIDSEHKTEAQEVALILLSTLGKFRAAKLKEKMDSNIIMSPFS